MKRRLFLILGDAVVAYLTFYASFMIRFEDGIPQSEVIILNQSIVIAVLVYTAVFVLFGLYRGIWRYFGAQDFKRVLASVSLATAGLAILFHFLFLEKFPRSVYFINLMLCSFFISGTRFTIRSFYSINIGTFLGKIRKRILIIGAGEAGAMIVADILRNLSRTYCIIGLVDDDVNKHGRTIEGIPVLGKIEETAKITQNTYIDEILIAIPSATKDQMRHILDICEKTNVKKIKTIPSIREVIDGTVRVTDVRDIELADLLSRNPAKFDEDAVKKYIEGKTVLVTGAGGSIGSELCKQICRFNPKLLILFERYENSLYLIEEELESSFPYINCCGYMGDINDPAGVENIFSKFKPQVIFHAAAYKHVPMAEQSPIQAVENNVFGTINVAECANRHGANKFILISTDKAVNPVSVMGVTKRIAEIFVQSFSEISQTSCLAVRFGNVLGSSGSVISLFEKQIRDKGRIKITHKDVERYFMTKEEAVQLLLQAATAHHNGDIIVLDMGEPIRIVDLARDLLKLKGILPDKDVVFEFVGLRKGDKLKEELFFKEENPVSTPNEKIMVAHPAKRMRYDRLKNFLQDLKEASKADDLKKVFEIFQILVPEYKSFDLYIKGLS